VRQQDLDHLYETIYDHGNGKYLGEASKAQREKALQIIESLRYELDAMSAIKQERDECYVVMRQALEALESLEKDVDGSLRPIEQAAKDALKERLK
jgi:HEAT repeat protein